MLRNALFSPVKLLALGSIVAHAVPATTAFAADPATPTFAVSTLRSIGSLPFAVAAGDLDGDGKIDLVVTDSRGATLVSLRGNGDGTFQTPSSIPTGRLPRGIALHDMNGDKHLDAVVACSQSNAAALHLGHGKGGFGAARLFQAGLRPFTAAVGDLNGDGSADVVIANESNAGESDNNVISVFFGDGKGGLERKDSLFAGRYPADARLADFNGDGLLDVIAANWGSHFVSLFPGDGKGPYGPRREVKTMGGAAYSVAPVDLNGDGKLDLVVADLDAVAHLFFGDGKGGFGDPGTAITGDGNRAVAVADFNGDGRPDIASANTNENNVGITLASPEGKYRTFLPFAAEKPRNVIAVDLNGDKRQDVVATNMRGNSLTVLLNTTAAP